MFNLFKSKAQKEAEAEQKRKRLEAERLEEERERQREKERIEQLKTSYETQRREYGYTKGHNGIVTLRGEKFYVFVSDNHLKFFICQPPNWEYEGRKIPQWRRQSIALQNIRYFAREGQVYTETKISGGGSKGVDLSGAFVGAALAGSTGAIIGSRSKTDPIQTITIRHDSRKTVLVYNKGQIELAPEDFKVRMRLIPEKEFSAVQQARAVQNARKQSTNSAADKLRELKSMLEEDLITQEEYDEKKTEILKRM